MASVRVNGRPVSSLNALLFARLLFKSRRRHEPIGTSKNGAWSCSGTGFNGGRMGAEPMHMLDVMEYPFRFLRVGMHDRDHAAALGRSVHERALSGSIRHRLAQMSLW